MNHIRWGKDPLLCALRGRPASGHPCLWSRLIAVAIPWALLGGSSLQAQQAKPTEYDVKAAYLYNFGKFVEWPEKAVASSGDAFSICVLGKDPFGTTLDATIGGETIDGKSVTAVRIAKPRDGVHCRILFISSSEESQLREILATLDKASVLTVSDMARFARRGGMIQFVMEANRVRFEVNLTMAERAGLTLSSQLLKLAISVRRSSPLGD